MTKFFVSCIVGLMVFTSCEKLTTNTETSANIETQGISLVFSDAINVIWHLDVIKIDGKWKDAEDFEPFTFIIGDSTFSGFDGCNWYGGRYELVDNKIFFKETASTEILCELSVFSSSSLRGTFYLEMTSKQLVLSKSDMVLKFTSNTTNGVKGSPLIGTTWQLTTSNAPEFDMLKSQDLLPRFEFDENRKFRVEWYCSNANIFGCNERLGFYGLGDNNIILFWGYGGSYSHPTGLENLEDQVFIERILKSTSYSISEYALRLYDETAGMFYEFSMQ